MAGEFQSCFSSFGTEDQRGVVGRSQNAAATTGPETLEIPNAPSIISYPKERPFPSACNGWHTLPSFPQSPEEASACSGEDIIVLLSSPLGREAYE